MSLVASSRALTVIAWTARRKLSSSAAWQASYSARVMGGAEWAGEIGLATSERTANVEIMARRKRGKGELLRRRGMPALAWPALRRMLRLYGSQWGRTVTIRKCWPQPSHLGLAWYSKGPVTRSANGRTCRPGLWRGGLRHTQIPYTRF